MTRKHLTLPAVMAGALGMGGSIAWAAEPTADELMKQIEQLQAKVQQLENNQQQSLTARDVDATVEKVLRDADRRSQLLQMEGFTAGWRDGFRIQSANGDFMINPYFQFQFRNVTNWRDFDDGGDDLQNGFEVRRMKFGFRGNAFTPDLTYNFRWKTNQNGGDVILEEAQIQYFFTDDMAFMVGQFKDNWTHEEGISSGKQLAVDRSMLNEILGGGLTDYVQGVALLFTPQDSPFRAMITYHDGLNTDNTDFQERLGGVTTVTGADFAPNFGVSGRVEWFVMGERSAYEDFSARGNTDDLLVLGAGANWTQAGSDNLILHTVDVQWETAGGLGLYGAYVGAYAEVDPGPLGGETNAYDFGFLVQAGYMLNDRWELFGRWNVTFLDDDVIASTAEDTFHEFTLGVNYYLQGHRAKVTIDLSYLPDGTPAGTNLTGIGYLAGEGDDQFAIRGQFQLLL
jgi:phosphate-selective porin OprO and OprP